MIVSRLIFCILQDASTQFDRATALQALTPRPRVAGARIVAPSPARLSAVAGPRSSGPVNGAVQVRIKLLGLFKDQSL